MTDKTPILEAADFAKLLNDKTAETDKLIGELAAVKKAHDARSEIINMQDAALKRVMAERDKAMGANADLQARTDRAEAEQAKLLKCLQVITDAIEVARLK